MALSKKSSFDISSQLNQMNNLTNGDDIPNFARPSGTFPDEEKTNFVETEKKQKKTNQNDGSVMVGFKLPKAAKDQYKEFFEAYGLNLSEAVKNALEYFAADVQKGKVKITLTRHFERVE